MNVGTFYRVVEGTKHCPRHGGATEQARNKKKAGNQYRLSVWKNRLSEFTEHEGVKSLRDEIGILRIVLEEMMNKCSDRQDLLIYSTKISELAVKIEKLVMSCDRLEKNMGQMMDRPSAMKFAAKVVEIVARHVDSAEQLDSISHEILEELR
jgi:hypothetical protein